MGHFLTVVQATIQDTIGEDCIAHRYHQFMTNNMPPPREESSYTLQNRINALVTRQLRMMTREKIF